MKAMPKALTHQHILRATDALMEHAVLVEIELARQIRRLVDHGPEIIFYDLTTVRIRGERRPRRSARLWHEQEDRRHCPAICPWQGANCRRAGVDIVARANGATMSTAHRATTIWRRPRPCKRCLRRSCRAF
jgi:hypothetical protein